MNAAAPRFEVLPGGRADQAAEGDTSWLDALPTGADHSPTSPWDPEHQLVGSLMWLPSDTVSRIATLVPPAAIERPITRWAYELITALAEAGQKPDPVLVLASAKHRAGSIAADPAAPPTAHRHHQLSVYLARAYTETNTALRELVCEVPAPVVAEMLGYSDQVVHRHAALASQPWAKYPFSGTG